MNNSGRAFTDCVMVLKSDFYFTFPHHIITCLWCAYRDRPRRLALTLPQCRATFFPNAATAGSTHAASWYTKQKVPLVLYFQIGQISINRATTGKKTTTTHTFNKSLIWMVLYTRALGNFHFVHSNLLNFKAAASVMAHFGDQHSLKAQTNKKNK